jgi:hypothetical protein
VLFCAKLSVDGQSAIGSPLIRGGRMQEKEHCHDKSSTTVKAKLARQFDGLRDIHTSATLIHRFRLLDCLVVQ